ncbi:MAG TPA: CRTAC1 family protein, partial [Candidatus Kapabacteria bacterium]|nr:CRTAC1 family protein [Candidatus Kapabacteria bacterium]
TAAGVDYKGHSSAATFFDVNNDGLLDLFVSNICVYTSAERGLGGYFRALPDAFSGHTKPDRGESSRIYINQGKNVFKESASEFGLKENAFNGDAAFADVNGDGFLDLYLSNMQGDDLFFLNEGGRKFTEATPQFFPKTPWGAMGLNFADFNQDGLLDLFVTDMHSDMSGMQTKLSKAKADFPFETAKSEQWCTAEYSDAYLNNAANNIFGNALYLATAPGKFTESSEQFAAETFWPWGMSVGDVNADGYPDAFITAGMGYGFRYGINSLLLNDAGKRFAPAELVTGVEPRLRNRIRKHAFTLDCSGADKDHPLCQGRTGSLPVSEVLSSRSSAMVDLDNDGDLDLVVNDMDDRPQILINSLAALGDVKWLKVKLRGTTSNRDGLGARITLTTVGNSWHQQHDGKSGYLAQSSLPLYLGLANAEKIDSLEITWPSGTKQKLTELKPNQLLTVQEPAK